MHIVEMTPINSKIVVRIPLHEKIKVVNVNRMQVGQVQLGTSK
jgi:hypothetical protein